MSKRRLVQFTTIFLLFVLGTAYAYGQTPLLQEGKNTLYQRVVTHPGAALMAEAAESAGMLQKAIKPFSVFYVYARQDGWLRVGPSSTQPAGWIKDTLATDWPQAMTLIFTERSGRMPVLFFKDEQTLVDIASADDMETRLQNMLKQIEAGNGATLKNVLASEPTDKQGAVARSRFYLMPIQGMEEPFDGVKFLRVASIDPGEGSGDESNGTGSAANAGKPDNQMRTAIAFVIDTTISMGPYIEQSLNVIRQAYDSIEKDGLGDSVAFAIVAFRNNKEASPGIEYSTRIVKDFTTLSNRDALENALAAVKEASASTHSFNEDSLAGVKTAVDNLSWKDYQSRVMVLITDAGPLPENDKYISTGMGPVEMLDYARARQIWVTVLHVRTPAGAKNHDYAEKAYRGLTRLSDTTSSYIAIPAPDSKTGAASFASAAKTLATSLTSVVKATASQQLAAKPAAPRENATPQEEALRVGQSIGYAMQLDFLGRQRANQAPHVVNAWIADMDLNQLAGGRQVAAVEVAVLLTKNQLSDLQNQLKIVIDQAERVKRTDAKDFFQSILSASLGVARDPGRFSRNPGQNLRQMGVMGEFLDGLPYKSDVMLLTEDDWYRMSVGQQTAFINRLRSRIARYEEYDKDTSGWESFGSPNPGDWVYRVPLNMLP